MSTKKTPIGPCLTASVLLLIAGGLSAASGPGIVKTWDDEADDNLWFTSSNWDPDGVPGSSDRVILTAPEPVTVQTGGIDVERIICDTGIRLAGLTFIQLNGTDSSEITILNVETCCITDVRNNGMLQVSGVSVWEDPLAFYGPGVVQLGGVIDANAGFVTRESAPVFVVGDALVQDGVTMQDVSSVSIASGGTLTWQGGSIQSFDDGALLIEGGTLARVAPFTGTLASNLEMSSGVIRSEVGTLEIRSEFEITGGALEAANDGELEVYGSSGMPKRVLGVTEYRGDGGIVLRANPTILSNAATNFVDSNQGLQLRLATHLQQTLTNQGRLVLFGVDVSADDNAVINNLGATEFLGTVDLTCPFWNSGTAQVLTNLGVAGELVNLDGEMILQGPGGGLKPVFGQPAGVLRIEGGVFRLSTDFEGFSPQVQIPIEVNGGLVANDGDNCVLRFVAGGDFTSGSSIFAGGSDNIDRSRIELRGSEPYLFDGQIDLSGTGAIAIGGLSGAITPIIINGSLNNQAGDDAEFNEDAGTYLRGDISGSGQIVNQNGLFLRPGLVLECTLLNTARTFVFGSQTWGGPIINESLFQHNTDSTVVFNGCSFENTGTHSLQRTQIAAGPLGGDYENNGTIEFVSVLSGTASIDVPFANNGTAIADNVTVFIHETDQIIDGTLQGGVWAAMNGGSFNFPVNPIVRAEDCGLDGDGDSLPWLEDVEALSRCDAKLGDLACSGSLSVEDQTAVELKPESTVQIPGEYETTGGSTTSLTPGSALQAEQVNIGGPEPLPNVIDTIEGVVQLARADRGEPLIAPVVQANIVNIHGRLSPASDGEGELRVLGALTLHENATLSVSVSALGESDLLTVIDPEPARLGGRVTVDVADPASVEAGDSYVIVESGSGFIGSFDSVEVNDGARSLVPRLVQSATTVSLVFTCEGDVTGDGAVDLADLNAVLGSFGFEGGAGDANGDGVVNLADLNAVLAAFGTTCP